MSEIRAKFVTVAVFRVDPGDLAGIANVVQLTVERKQPLMKGFIESVVMTNEEKTQLLVVGLWESRDAWAREQWDEDIGRVVSQVVKSAKSFEVRTYEPITMVRGESSP